MNKARILLGSAIGILCACGSSGSSSSPGVSADAGGALPDGAPATTTAPTPNPDGSTAPPTGTGRVVGKDGVAGYATLSAADAAALKATKVSFLHKSVGQNLTDGASGEGYSFQWADSGSSYASVTLGEKTFDASNGDPNGKTAEFTRTLDNGVGGAVAVAGFKFCYTDIDASTNLADVEAKYKAAMDTARGKYAKVRFFHVTTPLAPEASSDYATANPARLAFGKWLTDTFGKTDVVFDLQDVESTDAAGANCAASGVKFLCSAWAGDGDGHLSESGQTRAAKAFLYALHVARKGP